MSKTPSKNTVPAYSFFSPKELVSPDKNYPGISKTLFTHASHLNDLLNDWVRIQEKGTKVCKAIGTLKLYECKDDYYPHQLQTLLENLLEALEIMKNIVKGVEILNNHLKALTKLQPSNQPVIFTWSVYQISNNVDEMYISLKKECKLKEVITENLAHCRDEKLIDIYISAWEFDVFFDVEKTAYFFAEVGLPGIIL